MSVFTPVSREQLSAWLLAYDQGELLSLEGISEGVQNSNFFVDTTAGRHVLTLFEQVDAVRLPGYIDLLAHLSSHGISCPTPRPRRDGRLLGELNGRPAALFSRLAGASVSEPTPAHCALIGAALARLHLAGAGFRLPPHPCDAAWRQQAAARLLPRLAAADAALLESELAAQQAADADLAALPRGVIHADLFRDNALFTGSATAPCLGGMIDFYFAGTGELLFDLAVSVNDWCRSAPAANALLAAYQSERPLTGQERAAWGICLRAAALRFWLSRLVDFHFPPPGAAVTVRDPAAFRALLLARRAAPLGCP